MDFSKARYCNGFPIIRCNIESITCSIDSVCSLLFPSVPAEFCHKIHHRVYTYKRCGSWFLVVMPPRDRRAQEVVEQAIPLQSRVKAA
jgi:hypothetical protein